MLDAHEVSLNASAGVSLIDFPLKADVNISGSLESHVYGFPILRHRAQGAPPARDGSHNYVAGDPTGFLGFGMSGTLGGSARMMGALEMSGDAKTFMLGSNFIQMCRDMTQASWRDAAARGLSMLLARNHLQFHYTGLQMTPSTGWTVGTGVIEVMSAEATISVGACFIRRLHLFIKHPKDDADTWRYVYTRRLNLDLSFSAPYMVRYEGAPRWDQAWLRKSLGVGHQSRRGSSGAHRKLHSPVDGRVLDGQPGGSSGIEPTAPRPAGSA